MFKYFQTGLIFLYYALEKFPKIYLTINKCIFFHIFDIKFWYWKIFSITSFLLPMLPSASNLSPPYTYLLVNLVPHFLIVDANFSLTKNSRTFPSASKFLISQSPVRDPSRGIDFLGAATDDDDDDGRWLYGFSNKSSFFIFFFFC